MWYFGRNSKEEEYGWGIFEDSYKTYVEVTDEEHQRLVDEANAKNKIIVADEKGNPILADPPEPTEEEIKEGRIKELENFLSSTDWYAIRFADTGEPMPADIKQQRQDARDEISRLKKELNIGE